MSLGIAVVAGGRELKAVFGGSEGEVRHGLGGIPELRASLPLGRPSLRRGGRGGDSHRGGGGSYGGSYSSRRPYGGGDDYGPSRGAYREVYDRRGPYDRRDSDRSRGRDDYHYDKDRGYSNRGGYDDRSRGYDRRDERPRSR